MSSKTSAALYPSEGVLLFLALGARFGQLTPDVNAEQNPFDSRATALVQAFVDQELSLTAPASRIVYPGQQTSIDLRACLLAAGAQHESRLGIGIRPDCGTWYAVRAAVATKLADPSAKMLRELYPPLPSNEAGPCSSCVDVPCQTACPVGAVESTLNLNTCLTERLRPKSPCEARCAAREACPVGRTFMYPRKQIEYHYGVSLGMVRRWSKDRQ